MVRTPRRVIPAALAAALVVMTSVACGDTAVTTESDTQAATLAAPPTSTATGAYRIDEESGLRPEPAPTTTAPTAASAPSTTPAPKRPAADPPAPERTKDPAHPSNLQVGDARQVVVVDADGAGTTKARLQTWQLVDGEWEVVLADVPARLGSAGFAPGGSRSQGSGTTPAGSYRMTQAFGVGADPGTAMPYLQVDDRHWWPGDPDDPATYNVLQTGRPQGVRWSTDGGTEHLVEYPDQYRHAVVIDFNTPSGLSTTEDGQTVASEPADVRRGGAIFLHVNGAGATAGCVSISRDKLVDVLQWLDPEASPRIVMGPREDLASL